MKKIADNHRDIFYVRLREHGIEPGTAFALMSDVCAAIEAGNTDQAVKLLIDSGIDSTDAYRHVTKLKAVLK